MWSLLPLVSLEVSVVLWCLGGSLAWPVVQGLSRLWGSMGSLVPLWSLWPSCRRDIPAVQAAHGPRTRLHEFRWVSPPAGWRWLAWASQGFLVALRGAPEAPWQALSVLIALEFARCPISVLGQNVYRQCLVRAASPAQRECSPGPARYKRGDAHRLDVIAWERAATRQIERERENRRESIQSGDMRRVHVCGRG